MKKVKAEPGKKYSLGLLYTGGPYPEFPEHPRSCRCNGRGYLYVPSDTYCNCGSGEGCGVHNEAWMYAVLCEPSVHTDYGLR